MNEPARKRIPTADEVLARQKADLIARSPAAPPSTAVVPTTGTAAAVALPDNRDSVAKYLDEIAPSSIVGRMVKFSKNGKFVTADDGVEIGEDVDFVALCDQTLIGWIKFNDGAPPDRIMGALYDGFVMPPREDLGDTDESQWPTGLNGQPESPWKHQMYAVFQQVGTGELYTFVTASPTGRRSVGMLLRHYDRMQRTNPGELPVVRLRAGGFEKERVGWVPTPAFAVVGRAPRDSVAKPDTSLGGQMNDELPF